MRALSVAFALLAACGPSVQGGGGDDDDAPGDGPDAGDPGDGDPSGRAAVFAHSATELYRVDPNSFEVTLVGPFQWPGAADEMTDLAIDQHGVMIGISYGRVYRVDPDDARATLLSDSLDGNFNGLTFVPASQIGMPEADDVLVGARNTDGKIFSIDPDTGATAEIGDMGGDWVSSGDLVSIEGFGTVATVTTIGSLGADTLARLEPGTFHATPIGTTGYADLWGVGFWEGEVFGFSESGQFVLVSTASGAASPVETSEPSWWGAAVTTLAPVVE